MGTAAKTDQLKASGERDLGIIHLRRGAGGGGEHYISNRTQTSNTQRERELQTGADGQLTADEHLAC